MNQMPSLTDRIPDAGQGTQVCQRWVRAATAAAAVIIAGHGLVHLMGVALLWTLGLPGALRYADAAPSAGSTTACIAGGLWLVAAVLFVAVLFVAAAVLPAIRQAWRRIALAGVVISAPVTGLAPAHAIAGWSWTAWPWAWPPPAGFVQRR